jgi:hypothetical protein
MQQEELLGMGAELQSLILEWIISSTAIHLEEENSDFEFKI